MEDVCFMVSKQPQNKGGDLARIKTKVPSGKVVNGFKPDCFLVFLSVHLSCF